MRPLVVTVLVLTNAAVAFLLWNSPRGEPDEAPRGARPDPSWSRLDPPARCEEAVQLVTYRDRWPMRCRWRAPDERLQGQSFPPPAGPPPWDDPRVEIYVAETQTREELANAIAHEYGHMHHTREPDPGMLADWLAARSLPATTPDEIWTEDYAEVFAALFSPPTDRWRAPTPQPSPEALDALEARFFS